MTDLITTDQISKMLSFVPSARTAIASTYKLCGLINSFDDVENYLLKGAGLAAGSYRTYMTAVRQLYRYTNGLHPFQITAGHIEGFYDHWSRKVSRRTASSKITGLKRFFKGVEEAAPLFRSPFRNMLQKLVKKLSRTGKSKTKKALTQNEIKDILEYLEEASPYTACHAENYAIVLMLSTSGLRAAELCQLRWKDLEYFEGKWTARFIGKGEKEAEQEIAPQAVEAARAYFQKHFRRDPRPEDHLFWSVPIIRGEEPRPMDPHALWYRVKKIGKDARAEGIIGEDRKVVFSPHLFRRSFATYLYSKGMKLKALKELTRHSSIEVLADHYIDDREASAPYFEALFATA